MPLNGITSLPISVSFYLLVQDFNSAYPSTMGRDSVVGMATAYELYLSGFEIRWMRDISHPSRPAQCSTQPPVLYCIVVGSRRLMPPDALQPEAYCTNPGI